LYILAALLVLSLVGLFLWPPGSYDLSRVEPSIQRLQRSYQRVAAEYYLDGGSIGVTITDHAGRELKLAVPINDGPGDKLTYHRLFVGATYASRTGAVEVPFTPDTKRCLANVIARQASGPERDAALIALRGSPFD